MSTDTATETPVAPVVADSTPVEALKDDPVSAEETTSAPTEEAKAVEPVTATEATPAAEEKTPELVSAGILGYKGPGLISKLIFHKKYFWLQDEPIPTSSLKSYIDSEKLTDTAHHNAAWSSQSGKGLLYYVKREEDKKTPSGVICLADITEVAKGPDANEFSFKVSGKGHTFQAKNLAERDGWHAAIEASMYHAKSLKEDLVSSSGFKDNKESLSKPVAAIGAVGAAGAGAAAVKHHEDKEVAPVDETKAEEAKTVQPVEPVAPVEPTTAPVEATEDPVVAPVVAEETKSAEPKKSKSKDRSKRESIFGGVFGKKAADSETKEPEVAKEPEKELTPEEKEAALAAEQKSAAEKKQKEEALLLEKKQKEEKVKADKAAKEEKAKQDKLAKEETKKKAAADKEKAAAEKKATKEKHAAAKAEKAKAQHDRELAAAETQRTEALAAQKKAEEAAATKKKEELEAAAVVGGAAVGGGAAIAESDKHLDATAPTNGDSAKTTKSSKRTSIFGLFNREKSPSPASKTEEVAAAAPEKDSAIPTEAAGETTTEAPVVASEEPVAPVATETTAEPLTNGNTTTEEVHPSKANTEEIKEHAAGGAASGTAVPLAERRRSSFFGIGKKDKATSTEETPAVATESSENTAPVAAEKKESAFDKILRRGSKLLKREPSPLTAEKKAAEAPETVPETNGVVAAEPVAEEKAVEPVAAEPVKPSIGDVVPEAVTVGDAKDIGTGASGPAPAAPAAITA